VPPPLHQPVELADPTEHPLLGVPTHRTGVDAADIGVLRAPDELEALGGQAALHELGVGQIDLAARRLDVGPTPASWTVRHRPGQVHGRTGRLGASAHWPNSAMESVNRQKLSVRPVAAASPRRPRSMAASTTARGPRSSRASTEPKP